MFSILLGLNLLVSAHLVFRDLGNRMRKEAISGASARALQIAQKLAEEGQIDLYRVHQRITVISEYVKQVLTRERFVNAVSIYDAENRSVGSWTVRGGTVFHSGLGFHQPLRGARLTEVPAPPDPAQPTLRIDTHEKDRYVAAVPIGDGTDRRGAVEVGLDEDQLGREIDELRRSLIVKIAVGAAVSILLLLIAFVFVIRLLAKTRRLEAEAQMADRLAYVGTLASGLAHEIRNPLNAMNMNLQMLEEEIHAGHQQPEAETASLLSSTKGEIRRLESLVNDFLSYARPAEPRFETRDLNQTVDEVVRFLRAELQQKGVVVETTLPDTLPLVAMDEAQMRQALMNILINAKEVLGPGGRVAVSTAVGTDGDVLVSIQDNGPGIPEELRSKIFEVFYSTRGGGTGLGLPIAQRIMETHGGWIELVSEVGKGTTFLLHVPRAPRAEGKPAPVVAHAR